MVEDMKHKNNNKIFFNSASKEQELPNNISLSLISFDSSKPMYSIINLCDVPYIYLVHSENIVMTFVSEAQL
jgi:hypothetical protein